MRLLKNLKNYKEIFSKEGIIILYALFILATFIALRLDMLWPSYVTIFRQQIPDFYIFGWMFNQVIGYLIVPLFIILLFKERPSDYGWQMKKIKTLWWWIIVVGPIIIFGMFFISRLEQLQKQYPMYKYSNSSLSLFIFYESMVIVLLLSWEFFLRGFMLFGLERKFGKFTILIQLIPFVLMHYTKPAVEIYSAIIGGLILGIISLQTRSFIPGWILHVILLSSLDVFIVLIPK